MPTLANLRYPDTIVRRRYPSGDYDNAGRWLRGDPVDVELRASVQPVELERVLEGEGARTIELLRVYVPADTGGRGFSGAFSREFFMPGTVLRAVKDGAAGDRVLIEGEVYVVRESRTWGGHTRAILVRAEAETTCLPDPPPPDGGDLPFI